ncbi:phytochrome A-associated F-box protein-like [Lolium rigidum]|uniref:phytochrome A-associated F-box protein-like n=1 Tax=Lolium rigidum TaxID=89674 RepID=UPI001F5DBEB8|nr:phytochrome A-associated F-box protein-like [Lolium rigidum]
MSASEQEEEIAGPVAVRRRRDGKEAAAANEEPALAALADDVLLQILGRLEEDPRDWARASCASPRLAALLRAACFPPRVSRALPAELLPAPSADGNPAAWAALHKMSVCCPGLLRAGILLEPSDDFGLELDIGPDLTVPASSSSSSLEPTATSEPRTTPLPNPSHPPADPDAAVWSLYDDLYLDAAYDCTSEAHIPSAPAPAPAPAPAAPADSPPTPPPAPPPNAGRRGVASGTRRRPRRWLGPVGAHLASGSRTLSREQGNKLLASRFRGDRLYICDWPGCVHAEERRKYMVFRGVFQDFARSQVRRALRDTRRPTVAVDCAFCGCTQAWDLYSAFCLRSFYGYHDDGEPVVRAYVCENGHVAGAWTERPLYS